MVPDTSVIVTCHNYGPLLDRCLRSLINQQFVQLDNHEIIVVNDRSVDITSAICNKYCSTYGNIHIIDNLKNEGLPASCNKAIEASSGRYIVRVDADDYVSRRFIFMLYSFLNDNKSYHAVVGDYLLVDRFGKPIERKDWSKEFIACGIMYRKDLLYQMGLYNNEFKMREGHELHKRFVDAGYKIFHLPLNLYRYCQHDNNRTKNTEQLKQYDDTLGMVG